MIKYITNKKGSSEILGFLIISPILLWFFVYIIIGGAFLLEINQMTTIVNKSLDSAIVEGQYKSDLQLSLITELVDAGFTEDKLEITITPTAAGDSANDTYAERGEMIEIKVVYKQPHVFFYTNFESGGESKYYIGVQIQGMSEEW